MRPIHPLTADHIVPEPPDRLLRAPEAAARCGVSVATLKRLRAGGSGPAVIRLSPGRIGYRVGDLAAWLDSRRQGSAHD